LALAVGIATSGSAESSLPCPEGYGCHDDHIVQIDTDGAFRTERLGKSDKEDPDRPVKELFKKAPV
jgi:hypothetical protein